MALDGGALEKRVPGQLVEETNIDNLLGDSSREMPPLPTRSTSINPGSPKTFSRRGIVEVLFGAIAVTALGVGKAQSDIRYLAPKEDFTEQEFICQEQDTFCHIRKILLNTESSPEKVAELVRDYFIHHANMKTLVGIFVLGPHPTVSSYEFTAREFEDGYVRIRVTPIGWERLPMDAKGYKFKRYD